MFIYLVHDIDDEDIEYAKLLNFSLWSHFTSWPSEFISIITNWLEYWLLWPLVRTLIQILTLAEAEHSLRQSILCCSVLVTEIFKIYQSRENSITNPPCTHLPALTTIHSKSVLFHLNQWSIISEWIEEAAVPALWLETHPGPRGPLNLLARLSSGLNLWPLPLPKQWLVKTSFFFPSTEIIRIWGHPRDQISEN